MSLSSLQVGTQLFFPSFMCNNIHIPLNADLQKKGPISELSVQSLYLLSPNGGVSRDLTLGRQFSQRANVINGCHLRGGGGWHQVRAEKKSHPKEIVADRKLHQRHRAPALKERLKGHFQSQTVAEEPWEDQLGWLVRPSLPTAFGMKSRSSCGENG